MFWSVCFIRLHIYLAPPHTIYKKDTHKAQAVFLSVNELSFPTNFPPHKLLPFQKGAKFIGHHDDVPYKAKAKKSQGKRKGREK